MTTRNLTIERAKEKRDGDNTNLKTKKLKVNKIVIWNELIYKPNQEDQIELPKVKRYHDHQKQMNWWPDEDCLKEEIVTLPNKEEKPEKHDAKSKLSKHHLYNPCHAMRKTPKT